MTTHIQTILWKQFKDTFKNKTILIQFVMFPAITLIMENSVHIDDMPKHFFANLFAMMYVGMAPLTSAASIISEEKEKHTLRVLQMCNVKASAYLIGNAIYIITLCMAGSLVIGIAGGYTGITLLRFLSILLVGHCCSFVLGAAVGIACKNQMAATSVNIPIMMVLSFSPMLSIFNESIKKISKYIYSEQLYILINHLPKIDISTEVFVIMACNILLICVLFFRIYKTRLA